MRIYSRDDEQRVRLQGAVHGWARDGLVEASQASALDERLKTDLKRTNDLLRAALGFFTFVIVDASVALLLVSLRINDHTGVGITLLLAAGVCVAIAEYLAGPVRLYRYGIEEALAVSAVVLLAVSAVALLERPPMGARLALLCGAAGGFLVYVRFGLVYAAIGAMICAGLEPWFWSLGPAAAHTASALVFAAMFAVLRMRRRPLGDEFPGDEYAVLAAAACAGIYLSLNLQLTEIVGVGRATGTHDWYYWTTYGATWFVPAAALTVAIRDKDRPLLASAIVLAIVTLATNKLYLGWARQTWDPMILGVLLVGVSTGMKRWLTAGPAAQRHGYTADPLARDRDLLTLAGNVSVVWPTGAMERLADAPPSPFQGGRSGGGGGGATF